jgi:hypothetical protein
MNYLMHSPYYAGCFKTGFTALRALINLFRVHAQCFELS